MVFFCKYMANYEKLDLKIILVNSAKEGKSNGLESSYLDPLSVRGPGQPPDPSLLHCKTVIVIVHRMFRNPRLMSENICFPVDLKFL